jgi:hypothetical protein
MRRRGFKVAGGTGALPAWIEIAQTLIREKGYAEKIVWQPMLEKKMSEVPFDYGDDTQRITVPVHGATTSNDETDGTDESRADLNSVIDDYAASGNAVVRLALRGKMSDGVFAPIRRVVPFSARVKETTPPQQAPVPGGPGVPAAAAPGSEDKKEGQPPNIVQPEVAPPGDLAKNAEPVPQPSPAKENLTPDFPIPKFKIDDTFNSEDPVN